MHLHELLAKRSLNSYNKKVKKIFNLLTISGKYRVLGSASYEHIKYVNDFDLDEQIEGDSNALETIYKKMKEKYKEIDSIPNAYITDFKCGINKEGEEMHWTKKEVLSGMKRENNIDYSILDCILHKSILKMDIVFLNEQNIFTECSDVYFISLEHGKIRNYNEKELTKKNY